MHKMLDPIRKKEIRFFIGMFFLFVCIFIFGVFLIFKDTSMASSRVDMFNQTDLDSINHVHLGELQPETCIDQTFKMSGDILDSIEIKAGTFERINDCTLAISLIERDSQESICDWILGAEEIEDNVALLLELQEPWQGGVGTEVCLHIEIPDAEIGNSITLWASSDDFYPEGKLYIEEVEQGGDLWFQVHQHVKDNRIKFTKILLLVYFELICAWIIYSVSKKKHFYFKLFISKFKNRSKTQYIFDKKAIIAFLFFCALLAVFLKINCYPKNFYIESIDNLSTLIVAGEIDEHDTITQSFIANTPFDGFSINFCDYNNDINNNILIELYNITNNESIQSWEIQGKELGNNIQINFDLNTLQEGNGDEYHINILPLESTGVYLPFSIWTSGEDTYTEGVLSINGIVLDTDATFTVYTKTRNVIAPLVIFVFMIVLLGFCSMKKDIAKVAAFLTLGLGCCYLIAFAPFAEPDAEYHYLSSYKLSNIIMNVDNVNMISEEYYDMDGIRQQFNVDTAYDKVIKEFNAPRVYDTAEQVEIPRYNDLLHPIMYLIPAIAITIARILHFNFIKMYYFGRVFNLLAYTGVVYVSVKRTPKFKVLFTLTASLPMALELATSYSYDAFVIAMTLLYASKVVYLIYESDEVYIADILYLGITMALLAPAKVVYCLLGIWVYVIPREKFNSKKAYLRWNGSVLLCAGLSVFLLEVANISNVFLRNGSYMGNSVYSIKDIVRHPLNMLFICINTLVANGWTYIQGMIGNSLAGGTVVLSNYVPVCFMLLLLCAGVQKNDDYTSLNKKQKLITAAMACGVCGAVFLIFLLSTVSGQNIIRGMQGRYFLPVFIPFMMLLNSDKLISKWNDIKLIYVNICLQIIVISEVLMRIWTLKQ